MVLRLVLLKIFPNGNKGGETGSSNNVTMARQLCIFHWKSTIWSIIVVVVAFSHSFICWAGGWGGRVYMHECLSKEILWTWLILSCWCQSLEKVHWICQQCRKIKYLFLTMQLLGYTRSCSIICDYRLIFHALTIRFWLFILWMACFSPLTPPSCGINCYIMQWVCIMPESICLTSI